MNARYTQYERAHLPGIVALCEAEGWPSFPADHERAHAVLTGPGVTSVVALDDNGEVVAFAYLLSDGHIQAYLAELAVAATHRRQGIARALLEYAMPLTGAQRIDLVTDTAQDFYASLPHHTFSGFRIYPGWKPTDS
ncbi:acetyltransferase (GNAT) family protein [Kribbella voronezhensis]|uniref:Acetyltransferase (GNAT) family protein n=1 Tax=Kribbella voronezhensis TaxID=2512212 RepID=A0A4V3FJR0_9ACTN|nr:GNAT family N-acetyltransferase [Kribbella voronezhensis]TDU87283.1 acetyltransferase (GNAT) family protein [Kribbella voronezhensis]